MRKNQFNSRKNPEVSTTGTGKPTTSQLFRNFKEAISGGSARGKNFRTNKRYINRQKQEQSSNSEQSSIYIPSKKETEHTIPDGDDSNREQSFTVSTEADGKKKLSETEINDLVRKTIRRARENAKRKTQQQLNSSFDVVAGSLRGNVTFSPESALGRKFSWSSMEKSDDENDDNDTETRDEKQERDIVEERDNGLLDPPDDTTALDSTGKESGFFTEILSDEEKLSEEPYFSETNKNEVMIPLEPIECDEVFETTQSSPELSLLDNRRQKEPMATKVISPFRGVEEPYLSSILSSGGDSVRSGAICSRVQHSIDRAKLARLEITELLQETPQNTAAMLDWNDLGDDTKRYARESGYGFETVLKRGFSVSPTKREQLFGCASPGSTTSSVNGSYSAFFFSEIQSIEAISAKGNRESRLQSPCSSVRSALREALSAGEIASGDLPLAVGSELLPSKHDVLTPPEVLSTSELMARQDGSYDIELNNATYSSNCAAKDAHDDLMESNGLPLSNHPDAMTSSVPRLSSPKEERRQHDKVKSKVDVSTREMNEARDVDIEITVVSKSSSSSLDSEIQSRKIENQPCDPELAALVTTKEVSEPPTCLHEDGEALTTSKDPGGEGTTETEATQPVSTENDTISLSDSEGPTKEMELDDPETAPSHAVTAVESVLPRLNDDTARPTSSDTAQTENLEASEHPLSPVIDEESEAALADAELTRSAHKAARWALLVLKESTSTDDECEKDEYAKARLHPMNTAEVLDNELESARNYKYSQQLKHRTTNKKTTRTARGDKKFLLESESVVTEEFLAEISAKKGSKISASELAHMLDGSTSKRSMSKAVSRGGITTLQSSTANDSISVASRDSCSKSRDRSRSLSRSRRSARSNDREEVDTSMQSQFCLDFLDLCRHLDVRGDNDECGDEFIYNEDSNAATTWVDSVVDETSSIEGVLTEDHCDTAETRDGHISQMHSETTEPLGEKERRRMTFSFSDGRYTDGDYDPTSSDESCSRR